MGWFLRAYDYATDRFVADWPLPEIGAETLRTIFGQAAGRHLGRGAEDGQG